MILFLMWASYIILIIGFLRPLITGVKPGWLEAILFLGIVTVFGFLWYEHQPRPLPKPKITGEGETAQP